MSTNSNARRPVNSDPADSDRVNSEKMNGMQRSDRTRWVLVLLACLAVSLALVAYPLYVIRPFRSQGARELMVALAFTRFEPLLTVFSALVAVAAAIAYWRARAAMPKRVLVSASALLVCVLAVLSRVNVFE